MFWPLWFYWHIWNFDSSVYLAFPTTPIHQQHQAHAVCLCACKRACVCVRVYVYIVNHLSCENKRGIEVMFTIINFYFYFYSSLLSNNNNTNNNDDKIMVEIAKTNYPGGQFNCLPPITWTCKWYTLWHPSGPLFTTNRYPFGAFCLPNLPAIRITWPIICLIIKSILVIIGFQFCLNETKWKHLHLRQFPLHFQSYRFAALESPENVQAPAVQYHWMPNIFHLRTAI